MRCRLCGRSRVNDLEDGIYWCKDCDRYFNARGEVFYTEDGDIQYTKGRDLSRSKNQRLNKGYRFINHARLEELFDNEPPPKVANRIGANRHIIYNLYARRQDSAKLSLIEAIANAYNVDPEELIL